MGRLHGTGYNFLPSVINSYEIGNCRSWSNVNNQLALCSCSSYVGLPHCASVWQPSDVAVE